MGKVALSCQICKKLWNMQKKLPKVAKYVKNLWNIGKVAKSCWKLRKMQKVAKSCEIWEKLLKVAKYGKSC